MDRATLNIYIDTNITNKTTVGSLTPINEGDALKAVADYIDQEISAITPSSPLFTVYKAILTQSGTNPPTAVVVTNTIGTITLVYLGVGIFKAFSPDGLFTEDKTISISQTSVPVSGTPLQHIAIYRASDTDVNIVTSLGDASGNGILSNGILTNTPLIIEVYP